MYINKPMPGTGYIVLNIVLIVLFVAIPLFLWHFHKPRLLFFVSILVLCLAAVFIFGLFLHAGYHTEYRLSDRTLEMRCGHVFDGKVELNDIRRIRRSGFNWQTLGWAVHLKGYCNRFTNGVRIVTRRHIYFLSPRNPKEFINEVKSRMAKLTETKTD